jgi:hypothetical protein
MCRSWSCGSHRKSNREPDDLLAIVGERVIPDILQAN